MTTPILNSGANLANVEIEKAALGSLINGGRSLIDKLGCTAIDPNLFYHPQSRKIFGAIAELYDEGAPLDLQIVTERLRKQGNLEAAGGAAAITALGIDGNGDADIARFNLNELRSLCAKRQAALVADRIKSGDIDPEEAKAALDEIIDRSIATKSWHGALDEAVVTSSELQKLELKPRGKLLGDWFCEGDLGFIFAFRGVGKTWFALRMAQALATGGKLGDWQAHESVKVLYVDGEMPPDLMRDRCGGLQGNE